MSGNYVLITAAYNEERFIETTIRSVVAQTILPRKWIVVSDASSDGTDEIIQRHAARCGFIELLRRDGPHARNFGAQVDAINTGYARLKDMEFAFVGNVDADVALAPNYYESLQQRFAADPHLGLAGGFIHEDYGKGFRMRRTNSVHSVAHATQLFRRECFDAIGGYRRLQYGGPDWVAEIMARQRGWKVQAFPDLIVRHYRPSASAGGVLRGCYRQGRMDYSLGSLASFEIMKCLRRLPEPPYVLGALARMLGFTYSCLSGAPLLVPTEVSACLQTEQKLRLRSLFGLRPLAGSPTSGGLPPASPVCTPQLPDNARLSD